MLSEFSLLQRLKALSDEQMTEAYLHFFGMGEESSYEEMEAFQLLTREDKLWERFSLLPERIMAR